MKCENCKKDHDGSYGSGRFCCEKCARSFSTSKDKQDELKDANCPKCGKPHKIRKRASEKVTLCVECGGNPLKERDDRWMGICINCGGKLKRNHYLFCCSECSGEYRYLISINKWKLGLVDGIKGKFYVSDYIRKYLWKKYNNQCSRCGWKTPNPITGKPILEIEHIDGNCLNNKEENLDLICPNCHSLTTTYKALNKGNANRERLKYTKLI